MEKIAKCRKAQIFTKVPLPKKKGEYVYFIRIGEPEERKYKIGTTNDILRRMAEHYKNYKQTPIYILWVSPAYSKWTTLRVEENTIQDWKNIEDFTYIRNDRFIIPSHIETVKIKVRKTYEVALC